MDRKERKELEEKVLDEQVELLLNMKKRDLRGIAEQLLNIHYISDEDLENQAKDWMLLKEEEEEVILHYIMETEA